MPKQSTEWLRYKILSLLLAAMSLILSWINNGSLHAADFLVPGIIAISPFVIFRISGKAGEPTVQQNIKKQFWIIFIILITEGLTIFYPHYLTGLSWREIIKESAIVLMVMVFIQVNGILTIVQLRNSEDPSHQ